ncbi:hypothetical protein [Pelomonas sp. Root1444]|uniref:hypothetical protein n=1 Tax=Pelomonas sp. Root1444 TaxID=1736464 RepID=UPI000AB0FB98|nr:hypothetical protein [Pelomonas sp. Root1444]
MTPHPERDALLARREALAGRLSQGLRDEAPLATLQELQARLQLVDALLDTLGRGAGRSRAFRRQGIALLVVAALVSLAAWVRVPRVPFSLELEAGTVQLRLPEAGVLGGQAVGGEVRAEGFTSVASADATWVKRARDDGAGAMALRAERLALGRVSHAAGAELLFEGGSPAVRLGLEGAPHAAELTLGGAVSASFGGAPAQQSHYAVAEWIKLGAGKAATSLWLQRVGGAGLQWRGLRPSALRLVERQAGADGQVRLASSLRQATLNLPATERVLKLDAGSGLVLDGLRVDRCEVTVGDAVRIQLSGSAGHIGVQTGDFEQRLEPSWLAYAAHNHTLGLLWSAAGLLWGISTWLRKQFGDAS